MIEHDLSEIEVSERVHDTWLSCYELNARTIKLRHPDVDPELVGPVRFFELPDGRGKLYQYAHKASIVMMVPASEWKKRAW